VATVKTSDLGLELHGFILRHRERLKVRIKTTKWSSPWCTAPLCHLQDSVFEAHALTGLQAKVILIEPQPPGRRSVNATALMQKLVLVEGVLSLWQAAARKWG
jgi:hypothetical protein